MIKSVRISDSEARHFHADKCRLKMIDTLVAAWGEGKRSLVRQIIGNALIPRMGKEWHEGVAAALPAEQKQEFIDYVGKI